MSTTVAGVDGCRGGWLCVIRNANAPFWEQVFLAKTVAEILNHPAAPQVIAIDIPIGLPDLIAGAGRGCDGAVRKILGKRAGAVFAVPARAALYEKDYAAACAAAFAASDPPRKISKQMFHLLPKMREVDGLMTPALQTRLFECHPEGAFCLMNRAEPLHEPKKRQGQPNLPGLDFRRALLVTQGYSESFVRTTPPNNAGADDLLDACACAWTAARILKGEAIRFPAAPPADAKGLRMEIWA
jgi:predicted RNase H-like nuclease